MAVSGIGVVFEELFENMRLLAAQISDFPQPSELEQSQGARSGVASAFHLQLQGLSRDLAAAAVLIRQDLEKTELAVRATARDMAETDAAIAETARRLVEELDSIPQVPTSTASTEVGSSKAPGTAGTTGSGLNFG